MTSPLGLSGAPVRSDLVWETERSIQRGRIAALVLSFGLALSFGSDRSVGITVAVAVLAVCVGSVEVVLRRGRGRRSVLLLGWWSFVLDAVVCWLALSAVPDPVDPIVLITLMVALEAAVRWGAVGAIGGGLLAGGFGVAWAAVGYEAIGRDLPATSIAFRALAPVVIALPAGRLIERLRHQRERFRRLFAHTSEPILIVTGGNVNAVNPAAARLLGSPAEELEGEPFAARFGPLFGVEDPQALLDLPASERRTVRVEVEGRQRWYAVSAEAGSKAGPVFVRARDVTEDHQREQQLHFQAWHDPLTGLPNRAALGARVDGWLEAGHDVGVVFLDLDGFKEVNDRHGHAAGDEALIEVAERLRAVTRDDDVVHRWAGDEFCLAVRGVDERRLRQLVERVEASFDRPFPVGDGSVQLGASVGLATARPGDSAASLIHRADVRMYRNKDPRRTAPGGRSAG